MTLRIIALLIALAASVAGCTSTAPIYVEPSTQISVRQEATVLTLESLHASEQQRLLAFLWKASGGRSDALHLLIRGSSRLSAEAAHQARQLGIDASNIHLLGQHDRGPVRIEAVVYHARPPICRSSPLLNDESFDQPIGCSTSHNLAVMINDPRDLLDNRAVKLSGGDRAAIPVATYRTFSAGKGGL
ncbi:CpaD family pilus assembly lipoprotein [Ensifer sp. IC3342]|nr:CpaD family pilus assembly lipoprotein [Ensifer sp. IC4062]MCA1408306.1 CpaD family pilus assembly lipoprotein [Ensifer sp. BRP08]MCA1443527.1 CpaD family pilus assembly lipoprotein [Ensifer sp. IC4062]MCA1450659.1 CpaD family pilus assembly lipoprotein [Ensifer sp. IC3342]